MTRRSLPERPDIQRSRRAGPVLFAALAFVCAGCGGIAWRPSEEMRGVRALFAGADSGTPVEDATFVPFRAAGLRALAGAMDDETTAIEGTVPGLELFAGISIITLGRQAVGHDGAGTVIRWDEAYESGFGFDVEYVFRRPPRGALTLAAGDTFVGVRVMFESYTASPVAPSPVSPGPDYYDDMTIISGWLEGRTLGNPLDERGTLRPYVEYGAGVAMHPAVAIGGLPNWQQSLALGWHVGLGLEYRTGNLGGYFEVGLQTVGSPKVDEAVVPADFDRHVAQSLVTVPVRFGLMVGF